MVKDLKRAGNSYSSGNINIFNQLFYENAKKELIDELPNIFTKLDLFNHALYKKIVNGLGRDKLKVKEIASGKKFDRWETIMKLDKKRKWEVSLTDFNKELLPDLKKYHISSNFKYLLEVYSLFDNLPRLKMSERFDVILSTYAYDNVWLPQDLHLEKNSGSWHKSVYSLDFSKAGKRFNQKFFENINIKKRMRKINILNIDYGQMIDRYYMDTKRVSVNYPGGLIRKIQESFDKQLKGNGVFITADIAGVVKAGHVKDYQSVNGGIKIKIEDYGVAKSVLEELGYNVELKNLYEFIKEAGIKTPVNIYDHFVLLVKKI